MVAVECIDERPTCANRLGLSTFLLPAIISGAKSAGQILWIAHGLSTVPAVTGADLLEQEGRRREVERIQ